MSRRTFEINGIEYSFLITYGALQEYSKMNNIPMALIATNIYPIDLFYLGLKWGCKKDKRKFTLTYDEVAFFFHDQGIVDDELLMWLEEDMKDYTEKAKKKREELQRRMLKAAS